MYWEAFGAADCCSPLDATVRTGRPLTAKLPRRPCGFSFGWILALFLCSVGCVERRMTIRSNVDDQGGALVLIDKQEVGVTPVSTGFTYYAPREVRLIKDGYETLTLIQDVSAPWWDSLPIEFFVENLIPFTLRDEREFHYTLSPAKDVSTDELLRRAQSLRNEGRLSGGILPADQSPSGFDNLNF